MADFFDRQLLVPLLQSTVCAVLVVAMLVAIGDYNTPQGGGPVLRSSDDRVRQEQAVLATGEFVIKYPSPLNVLK